MADLTPAEFADLWRLRPQAAAEYLQGRSELLRSFNWQDVYGEEHVRNFTVSRLTALDVLQDVYGAVVRSVGGDLTRRDFIESVEQTLVSKGWWGLKEVLDEATGELVQTEFNPPRLQLIYDTNTRMAHAAGQWERIQRNKRLFPYLRYVSMDDKLVRPEHARWHNVTLPVDAPFWQTHYPPNGWRCRCRVVGVSEREYEAGKSPTGADLRKAAPRVNTRSWTNQRTGQVREMPEGVAPGFDYNVGIARQREVLRLLTEKAEAAEPKLAAKTLAENTASPAFASWYEKPDGAWPLVIVPRADAEQLGASVHVAQLSQATAQKQRSHHPELSADEYLQAQSVIDDHTNKVLDEDVRSGIKSMIYVRETDAGYVLVVKATRTGRGIFVTSMRRLPLDAARRMKEIARLLRKGQKQ